MLHHCHGWCCSSIAGKGLLQCHHRQCRHWRNGSAPAGIRGCVLDYSPVKLSSISMKKTLIFSIVLCLFFVGLFIAGPYLAHWSIFPGAYRDYMAIDAKLTEFPLGLRDGTTVYASRMGPETSSELIVYLHGNAESAIRNTEVELLAKLWPTALVVGLEYRGYGRGAGRPSRSQLGPDFVDQMQQVLKRYNPTKLMIYCFSLGGAVGLAGYGAAASSLRRQLASAVWVFDSTFANSLDLVPAPLRAITLVFSWGKAQINSIPPARRLGRSSAKVFVMGGKNDEIIPWSSQQRLARALGTTAISSGTRHCSLSITSQACLSTIWKAWNAL